MTSRSPGQPPRHQQPGEIKGPLACFPQRGQELGVRHRAIVMAEGTLNETGDAPNVMIIVYMIGKITNTYIYIYMLYLLVCSFSLYVYINTVYEQHNLPLTSSDVLYIISEPNNHILYTCTSCGNMAWQETRHEVPKSQDMECFCFSRCV